MDNSKNQISEGLKGYFAGFLDGEGTLTIGIIKRKQHPYRSSEYRSTVCIYNTVKKPLQLLQEYYYGTVTRVRKANKGPTGKIGKELYAWVAMCNKAYIFLIDVLPYLIIMKERAQILIELQERKTQLGIKLDINEINERKTLHKRLLNTR